jgi:Fe-S cluster assembly protein SufB
MPAVQQTIEQVKRIDVDQYKYGFETKIESVKAPKGLNERTVRFISEKKGEPAWMLEWRLEAFRRWKTMTEPAWANVHYPKIDFQNLYYYSAPKSTEGPKSLDEVDPELLRTYARLGIPLREREILAGVQGSRVAVDAVFDSVSVVTTFKEELGKAGVIFCAISEAVRNHPDLVKKYLGSVVPQSDNFYASLNSAVFSDGSFVYVPEGVRCPMELSTYFRINEKETGQFERTLIVADKGSYVSYLEGCTAPMRDEHQLHAAVVELIALDDAEIKYSTVQNWYPGDKNGKGGIYNFVTKRGDCRGHNSKISWTQVDLEVSELHPARRQQPRRVLLDRCLQRLPAGRQRHQDDPPGQGHIQPDHLQGHRRRALAEHLPRPRLGAPQGHQRAQLHQLRFAPDRRQVRRPHRAVYRGQERVRAF